MNTEYNYLLERTANRLDLTISQSGDVVLDRNWNQNNVCSPYSRLYFVYDGEGVLRFSNGEALQMERGNLYLIPTGMQFSYACTNRLAKVYFHINLLKPDGYDVFAGLNCVPVLQVSAETVQELRQCYARTDIAGIWQVKRILYETVGTVLQQYPQIGGALKAYSPLVQRTLDYIREHLSIKLSVQELADELFVSKSFLGRRFREEVGVPPSQYMDDQLFFSAQWRLLQTQESIAEISEQFGFCDPFYFSRRFKQKCGETPSQYRRKIRAEKISGKPTENETEM